MSVTNPKTGEKDYIDLSLVKTLSNILDSKMLIDVSTKELFRISYSLEGDKENDTIILSATFGSDHKDKETHIFTLQEFEEILAEAVYAEDERRLEQIDDFKSSMDRLAELIKKNQLKKNRICLSKGESLPITKGLGMIYNPLTGKDIGTFEKLEYRLVNMQTLQVFIDQIIISDENDRKLKEGSELIFYFYEIDADRNPAIYEIKTEKISNHTESSLYKTYILNDVRTDIKPFTKEENQQHYEIIEKAYQDKIDFNDLNKQDMINDMKLQNFKQKRIELLEESCVQAKKEKIVKQFEDIDIDL